MRAIIAMSHGGGALTKRMLRASSYVLLAFGIVALGYAGYAVLDLFWYQGVETSKFETAIANAESQPVEAAPIADRWRDWRNRSASPGVEGDGRSRRFGETVAARGGTSPGDCPAGRTGKYCAGGPSRWSLPAAAQRSARRHNHAEDVESANSITRWNGRR